MRQQFKKDEKLVKMYKQKYDGIKDKNAKLLIKSIRGERNQYYDYSESRILQKELSKAFEALTGYKMSECKTIDDLFNPKIVKALTSYVGDQEMIKLRQAAELILDGPFTKHSYYRPSYRSNHVGLYAAYFFSYMTRAFDNYCYTETIVERLKKDAQIHVIDVALALRARDPEVIALTEEAIMGDNSEVTLTSTMIYGIMIAGCEQELEWLGKLFLVAKGQEGIRQSILETCDMGNIKTHQYFINLILEHDLCRFSSVIRAFGTWTGLAYSDVKQKVVEKHMRLAAKYLDSDADIEAGLDSDDVVEIYMALWAQGCTEIKQVFANVERLLQNSTKYKRLVGWYFIRQSNDPLYALITALRHLDVRDPEELAWICSCISGLGLHRHDRINISAFYKPEEIESIFHQIAEIIEFIGKKSTKFTESVFPWITQTLSSEQLGQFLIGLAKASKSEKMLDRLADVVPLLEPVAREIYYKDLLKLDNPKHRKALFAGLSDRSKYAREAVVKRLSGLPLDNDEILLLVKKLTSKSATLRKAIMMVLDKQVEDQAVIAIDYLLVSKNNEQLLAGAELLELNENLQVNYTDKIAKIHTI